MRMGRRTRINGSVEWVELDSGEVDAVIRETAAYNRSVFALCWAEAREATKVPSSQDRTTVVNNPDLREERVALALAFFERLGVSAYTALKERLERRINAMKAQTIAMQ